MPNEDSIGQLEKILQLPGIFVEGIYTHLANADSADRSYSKEQLERFFWFLNRIHEKNIFIPIKHAANSAGLINYPEAHLDMVRPGIVLYGLSPSADMKNTIPLKPVMSPESRDCFSEAYSCWKQYRLWVYLQVKKGQFNSCTSYRVCRWVYNAFFQQ